MMPADQVLFEDDDKNDVQVYIVTRSIDNEVNFRSLDIFMQNCHFCHFSVYGESP